MVFDGGSVMAFECVWTRKKRLITMGMKNCMLIYKFKILVIY